MTRSLPFSSTLRFARTLPRQLPGWTREPLLHFLVMGALLFAIDHAISAREDDPRVIVLDAAVDAEASRLFAASRGRQPTGEELQALRRTWLDNEVLYREGLAMQVDRGDTAIRERVIFKALSIVDAGLRKPVPDEAVLRGWFETNRARYDQPARFDFQEAVLSGEPTEAAVRGFVDRLNGGTRGDADAGLRVFKDRPYDNVAQSYGPDAAQALESSPPGSWQALRTRDGWRAMRLDGASSARPAEFATMAGVVLQDWLDVTGAEQRTAAVRALASKYRIRELASPR